MTGDPDPDLLDLFGTEYAQFDDAMSDPLVADTLKEAKELNELLLTEALTASEADALITSLNARWYAIYDTVVTVSGSVAFPTPEGEPFTQYYDEARMLSKGFGITGGKDETVPVVGRKIMLNFEIDIPESVKEEYDQPEGTTLFGIADIEQVSLTLDGVSLERAKAWLNTFSPDFIAKIDAAILNTDGSDQEIIETLQELDLEPGLEEPDRTLAVNCIGVYINAIVGFHRNLPYVMDIRGHIIANDAAGTPQYAKLSGRDEWFVYINDVEVTEVADRDKDTGELLSQYLAVHLNAVVINPNVNGSDMEVKIPVDSVNAIESTRALIPEPAR